MGGGGRRESGIVGGRIGEWGSRGGEKYSGTGGAWTEGWGRDGEWDRWGKRRGEEWDSGEVEERMGRTVLGR